MGIGRPADSSCHLLLDDPKDVRQFHGRICAVTAGEPLEEPIAVATMDRGATADLAVAASARLRDLCRR